MHVVYVVLQLLLVIITMYKIMFQGGHEYFFTCQSLDFVYKLFMVEVFLIDEATLAMCLTHGKRTNYIVYLGMQSRTCKHTNDFEKDYKFHYFHGNQ